MSYDYKDGKQRVENILKSTVEVIETKSIPQDESKWTYANAMKTWVSAIFVDLRDSTNFLENGDQIEVTKTLRSYASEIIEIMNGSNLVREIGVRGDGIYGIYSSPTKESINEVLYRTYWINTYMDMLNELLEQNGLNKVKAGIGMASSQDLIAKVGRKGTGINDKVWIGKCVAEADRLSKITNKGFYTVTQPIAISHVVYNNAKDIDEDVPGLFTYNSIDNCYYGNVTMSAFQQWIKEGMEL